MSWFDEARFGMFIHWDHASQQGLEVSWPLVGGVFALPDTTPVSVEQYHSSAATFDPQGWDAPAVARAAKAAGMRYGVLTTKHHSGYAMWPSRVSDWSVAGSPFGQKGNDIVGQFVDAFRAEGLAVGLYYSLSDWHHPDYPPFAEEHKPYILGSSPPRPDDQTWDRYLEYMFAQITELLTDYGRIDLLWFDGGWERPDWKAPELDKLIRSLQPDIIINDRLPGHGDYDTPEQFIPDSAPSGPWETCLTMNHSWGWVPKDPAYKSARRLIHTLCETAGKGGNLLLNVSPMGTGELPPEQVERLAVVGRWMRDHGESIRGTTAGLEPWQFYGPSTRKGNRLFLHLPWRPYDSFRVRGIRLRTVESVRHLATGESLEWAKRATAQQEMFGRDPVGDMVISVPERLIDPVATVVEVTFAD